MMDDEVRTDENKTDRQMTNTIIMFDDDARTDANKTDR